MNNYDVTWQAVGLSSNPEITRDPISLHMQNYLKYGSKHSNQHLVVVDDILQHYNYCDNGFIPWVARQEIETKGYRKLLDLKAVARANGLNNIQFVRLSKVLNQARTLDRYSRRGKAC